MFVSWPSLSAGLRQALLSGQLYRSMGTAAATPVFKHAKKHSNSIAIRDEIGDHTYSDLYARARTLAQRIQPMLETKGQKVAFITPNSSQYVVAQWAVWMCGGVAVPLCQSHPLDTLRYYVEDSGSSLILAAEELASKVHPLNREVVAFSPAAVGHEVAEGEESTTEVELGDPAMILYTSGTTGPPKGVVLSHHNLESQTGCLISAWNWSPQDRILHVLPLHHTHGIVNCLLCPLTVGASVHMLPKMEAAKAWSLLTTRESQVNVFMAVPTIYAKMLEHFEKEGMTAASITEACKNIRLMVSGSAALPTPVLERWREATGHTLLERYGMTEIGMALSNPLDGNRVPGAVGRPLPGVSAKIVRWKEDGSEEILATGDSNAVSTQNSEEGELLISGPNVFQEYHNKPEATKKEFTADGWFKTGDTCKIENGVFKILGRTSVDIIKSGGYKISALDVERILLTHPDIQDVAVVGVPDLTWGQKVGAVIVPVPGSPVIDLNSLRTWCSMRMAKYWMPSQLRILEEMPRNAMGKVNKKELLKAVFPQG